jgi:oligopeptidase B
MKNYLFLLLLPLILVSCSTNKSENIMPPIADKVPKQLTKHGHIRVDNYYWMNERENPKVLDHLNAENAYTQKRLKHTKKLQQKLYDEMVGRIKQDENTVPYLLNGYYYYTRYEEGKEYPIYCRKKGNLDFHEEIMLNVNEMAIGFAYYRVAGLEVSLDNELLAFGVDTLSRRKYTLQVKNLETGKLLKDSVPNTAGSYAWANDNGTLFYTTKDTTLRPSKVWKHKLGTEPGVDDLVFHETENTFNTYISKSKSNQYLYIISAQTLSTEYRYLDANNPDGVFKVFHQREKNIEYNVTDIGEKFYVLTNYKAKNFRLMECKKATAKKNWKEVIAHRDNVLLSSITVFKDFLVVNERENGLRQIRIINQVDGGDFHLDFGEEAYVAYATSNYEMDTNLLRYSYTSLTTPQSTFDFNMNTREKKLLKQQEVVGGYNLEDYETKRLFVKVRDGVQFPISIVYKKGHKMDGTQPLLLYGYGSYGASMEPYFSSSRLSLLDRGFSYAIAHIRGGEEMGRHWYEDGKLLKKKNTFYDFIDCGDFLIKEEYTSPNKIFAAGGSAGGLLIGAVINYRPDLFNAVIAAVPWVDVVTTMLDETIPLTTSEYDEWGNPNNKEYYDYMLSYSPYDNVAAKAYPAMLVTTGLHDSQVQYFEPTKWVAKLRELKTDDNMLIMDVDMETGHGGQSGRFKRFKRTALEYAFLLDQIGVGK